MPPKKSSADRRLFAKLRSQMDQMTGSEQVIANFLLTNRQTVPFETANSLAAKLAISAVTVGRFCRRLGYRNFRELKTAFKFDVAVAPWPIGEGLRSMLRTGGSSPALQRDLDLTIAGVIEVYRLAETREWQAVVARLAHCATLHVVGFQTERGLAAHFANFLQYVRPGVRVADLAAGSFAEILIDGTDKDCVVIVETRRYSRQAQLLARHCRQRGLPLVLVTDKYCHWAGEYTPHILALPTESGIFWGTTVPILAALALLANGVVHALGNRVEQRLARVSGLYQEFVGHVGKPARKPRKPRDRPSAAA
ncbi:MAG: MurR/RpiR family transcriptional regulator [Proteobacteria bacterium]|nr:MurR/RpiR family transcriptional regulator [Pseudomonadota bacterium]